MDLKRELAKPEYSGLTDAQCVDRLNAPIVTGRRLVPLSEFVYRLFTDATWATLQAATQSDNVGLRAAAVTVYDYLRNPHVETIDLDLPATKAALGGLVAAGVFSQELVSGIDALANVTTSKARRLGFLRPITEEQVRRARQ